MPQAIVTFVGWAAGAIVGGLTAVGLSQAAAVAVLDFGIKLAALAGLAKLSEKLFGLPDIATPAHSFGLTTKGTIEYQRIIYGETLASGPLIYMNTAGTNNQSLYQGVALAGHEIEDITDVWLDDNEIPNAAIDWAGNGSVDSGWLRGTIAEQTTTYFDKFLALPLQSAPSDLVSTFTEWTNDHEGRGVAWFLTRMDYFTAQAQVWSAGAPANYKALVKGKKVYDPRSDSTQSFGTGPHRLTSSGTWEWSDNPALCWADYMIDSHLGFGEDSSRIDYGYVASAAEYCEQTVNNPTGADPLTDNRYRCDGVLSTGDTYEANIEKILSSMNGTAVLLNGTWRVRANQYVTPTLSFNEDDLRGDVRIQLDPSERERFNTVRGHFIDKDRLWQPSQFPEVTAAEYVTRDNGQTLYRDISLDMTKNVYMAQRLAFGILEQSDLEITAVVPTNFKTIRAEVGGTIQLSLEKMGWTDKVFRVMEYQMSDMGGIDLVVREDDSSAYTDVGTDEYTVSSGGGYATADPGVPAPTDFTLTNGQEAMELNWVNPAARLFETIEIWRNTVNSFDNATLTYETKTNNYQDAPLKQGTYYYYIRAKNYIGEVSTRVPSTAAGLGAVFVREATLVADPGFEYQGLGQSEDNTKNVFWTDIRTSNPAYTSFSINSDGTNATETPFLHFRGVRESGNNILKDLKNKKWTPIIPGLKTHMWMQYRVPVYSNITSAYIIFWINAWKSFSALSDGEASSPLGVGSRGIAITNSIGWTAFSETLNYSDLTLTSSYTVMSAAARCFGYSDPSTGTIEIDIDKIFLNYVS